MTIKLVILSRVAFPLLIHIYQGIRFLVVGGHFGREDKAGRKLFKLDEEAL